MQINITEKTFYEYLCEYAMADKDKCLLFNENERYTCSRALALTDSLAGQMARFGVRAGTLVALESYRTIQTTLLVFALQALGAVAVLIDPRYPVQIFLEKMGTGVNPDFVLSFDGQFWHISKGDIAYEIDLNQILPYDYKRAKNPKIPAFIIFTSGTTGGAKAVMLSQFSILNNSEDTRERGWYVEGDISIALLPVFHVFGLSLVLTAVVLRHSVFFPEKTEVKYILFAIEKYKVTRLNGVPSLYLAMADMHIESKENLSSLRTGLIGGGPCTKHQFEYIERELGLRLIPVYGMSECIGISCGDYHDRLEDRSNNVGRPYSMNKVYIVNEYGEEEPVGTEGEICVESPFLMMGYVCGESVNQVLKTGDIGYLDKGGFLHISGRKKDIIICNGNNISVCNIERALLSIDCVRDAAVVGKPDERYGEIPCAMVVLDDGADITESYIHTQLARYLNKCEMPRIIIFTDGIPLTATGKHDKRKLNEIFSLWKEV